MEITHKQMAEILTGMARTHAALLTATFDQATILQKVHPAIQGAAQLSNNPQLPMNLVNFYPRLLLNSFGGGQRGAVSIQDHFAQELERLIPNTSQP